MTYTYPDKEDKLTCQLIDTEFDGAYWGKSEDEVLRQAMEAVDHLVEQKKARGQALNLLDLGCGMGRLFTVFAEKADVRYMYIMGMQVFCRKEKNTASFCPVM